MIRLNGTLGMNELNPVMDWSRWLSPLNGLHRGPPREDGLHYRTLNTTFLFCWSSLAILAILGDIFCSLIAPPAQWLTSSRSSCPWLSAFTGV